MKSQNRIILLFLSVSALCLFIACGSMVTTENPLHSAADTGNSYLSPAASSQDHASAAASNSASDAPDPAADTTIRNQNLKQELMKFSELVGQPDSRTVAYFGTGTTSDAQDQEMICREYQLHMFGETVKVHVNYDQNVVHGIVFYLKGKHIEDYEEILTKQLGNYTQKEDFSELEDGSIAVFYPLGDNSLVLRYSFDTAAIEIT